MRGRIACSAGAVALICAASSAGCSPKVTSQPTTNVAGGGYYGATRSIGAMVASPNRCAFSFVYDDFITERIESDQGTQKKANMREAVLRGPSHIAGAAVKISVRGAYFGAAGPIGTLLLQYGDAQSKTELSSDGKETSRKILSELQGRATSGDNAVKVTVTLADPVDGQKQQRVDIDSMDVVISGDFCNTAAEP